MLRKQRVKVDVFTWRGASIDAEHWYVTLQPWPVDGMPDRKDLIERRDFLTEPQAYTWARAQLRQHFSPERYLLWVDYERRLWPFADMGYEFTLSAIPDGWPWGERRQKTIEHAGVKYLVVSKHWNYTIKKVED